MASYPSQLRPKSGYPNIDPSSGQNMQIGNIPSPSSSSGAAPPNHPNVRHVGPPPSFATGRPLAGEVASNGTLVIPERNPPPMSGTISFSGNLPPAVAPSGNQVPFSGAPMNQLAFSNGPLVSRPPPPPLSHQKQYFQTPSVNSSILPPQHPEIRPPPSSLSLFVRAPPTSRLPFTGAVGGPLNSKPPFFGGPATPQMPSHSLNSSVLPSSQQFSRMQPLSQHTGSEMLHRPPTIGSSYEAPTWNLQSAQPPPQVSFWILTLWNLFFDSSKYQESPTLPFV